MKSCSGVPNLLAPIVSRRKTIVKKRQRKVTVPFRATPKNWIKSNVDFIFEKIREKLYFRV